MSRQKIRLELLGICRDSVCRTLTFILSAKLFWFRSPVFLTGLRVRSPESGIAAKRIVWELWTFQKSENLWRFFTLNFHVSGSLEHSVQSLKAGVLHFKPFTFAGRLPPLPSRWLWASSCLLVQVSGISSDSLSQKSSPNWPFLLLFQNILP